MMTAVQIGIHDITAKDCLVYNPDSRHPYDSKILSKQEQEFDNSTVNQLGLAADAMACPVCSRLFDRPITLSCGFSVCTSCLPHFNPATVQNFDCPVPECAERSHIFGELKVDVTLHKLVQIVSQEMLSTGRSSSLFKITTPTESANQFSEHLKAESYIDRIPCSSPMSAKSSIDSHCSTLGDSAISEVELPWNKKLLNELECQVCYCLLNEPLTTPCGHTFCKACLLRFADHSNVCAICRSYLPIARVLQAHPLNATLSYLISTIFPYEQMERQEALNKEEEQASSYTPIFVCNLAFPTIPSYLHVFEPRYRLMIRRCLAPGGSRRFGMCIGLPDKTFSQIGTMLEVQNVESLNDGRYIVRAVGSFRFRIKQQGMRDGYHTAQIERFDDELQVEEHVDWERQGLVRQQGPMPQSIESMVEELTQFGKLLQVSNVPWILQRIVRTNSKMPTDLSSLSWWMAATIPIDDHEKLPILQTTNVRERLTILCRWIQQVKQQWWFEPLMNGTSMIK
jgi:Lon protease-like protein